MNDCAQKQGAAQNYDPPEGQQPPGDFLRPAGGHALMTRPANANGHRRRELIKRVKAEETHCALCGRPVDKTIRLMPGHHSARCADKLCKGCVPDPMSGEVDEDLPRSRGGSPIERDNTRLMHRQCNQFKGDMTLAEASEKYSREHAQFSVRPSNIW